MRKCLRGCVPGAALAAGLLLWPAAAAAMTPGSEDDAKARSAWAAALQEERSGAESSSLALRLFGGFQRTRPGDVNDALDGFFELLRLYSAHGYGTTAGDYRPLRDGYLAGADLVLRLTRNVGVGIGAGYVRLSESSSSTLSNPTEALTISSAPTLSAVPVRLGLFLTLPLVRGVNLTVCGGAEAYASVRLDVEEAIEYHGGERSEGRLDARRNASLKDIGGYGSLGLELELSRSTGAFVEALGRYARLGGFDTARFRSGSDVREGRLFLQTSRAYPEYSRYVIEETVADDESYTYRRPRIDLSGFSLQAGLRIRL